MKWSIYALFAVMPFTQVTVGSHLLLLELVLFAVLFFLLMSNDTVSRENRIIFLDIMVAIYALFSLASVAAGADDLYNSMRYYRWNVLAPVMIYFVLRKARLSPDTIKMSLLLLIPGVLVQAGMFVNYYRMTGMRPEGVQGVMYSAITLSAIFAIGAWVLLFMRRQLSSKVKYILLMGAFSVLVVALFISFTRMAIIPFILFTPFAHYFWKKTKLRKQASYLFVAALVAYVIVIMASAVAFKDIQIEDRKKVQGSIERVYNLDLYIRDITGRMAFQGGMARQALEHPILGLGGANYYVELGSSHNILVSSLVVGGIPGLVIFVLLIWGTYRALIDVEHDEGLITALGKILWCSFTMLMMIAITNDVTGARILFVFLLMGLIGNLSLERAEEKKLVKREDDTVMPRVIYAKKRIS